MHLDVFTAVSLATLKLCVVHGQKHVFGCTAGMGDEMRVVLESLLLWLHPVTNNGITWDIILCLICSTTLHYNCMKVYSVVSLLRFQNPEIRYPIETAVFFYPRNILVPKLFRMKLSAKLMWCKNYKCRQCPWEKDTQACRIRLPHSFVRGISPVCKMLFGQICLTTFCCFCKVKNPNLKEGDSNNRYLQHEAITPNHGFPWKTLHGEELLINSRQFEGEGKSVVLSMVLK